MLKSLIQRKFADLITRRVNSTAHIACSASDNTKYSVRLNKSGIVVGASFIKEQALQKLREASVLYSLVDPTKEEEIIVWMRLQHGMDKPELLDFVSKTFNVDLDTAEVIFTQAFPDGLDFEEEKAIESLENLAMRSQSIDAFDILDIVDFLSGSLSHEPLCKNTEDYNIAKLVVASMLRKRYLLA